MRKNLLFSPVFLMLVGVTAWAGAPPTESQIKAGIQSRMYHAQIYQHGDVQVTCDNGVATLTGTVDNLGSKLDAEKAARKTRGVTCVIDNIVVRADDVTEAQILAQARHEILMYYAYGIFDNVNLEAQGGRLIVYGQVTQPFKKSDIGNILTRVKGVAGLANNLEVLPTSMFDDRLRLQVAQAIYGNPYFIHYADQAEPPIHIIVKNGNVTLEGVVANTMDRTRAEMAARSAGLSFAVADNLRIVNS
jgi:hyperosmotically inducible periplasmic protein